MANRGGTLTIESSTLTGNKALNGGGDAGAILNFGEGGPATLTIRSSTISGNQARLGGGINSYNDPGNAITITDSTIAFNDSGDRGFGGGLALGSGTATVKNTILAKNTSTVAGQEDCSADPGSTISSAGYNLEGATSCGFTSGTDKQSTDPLLGPLTFNGGPTPTHAIGPESPAFEAGDPACLPADQRGVPRPQGPVCDIGAFEAPDQTPPETAIVSAPAGPTTDHTPTFGLSAGEAGSRFECSIDGGAFEPCTSPFTTPPLAAGSHTLAVRAIDPAGNVDPTPSVIEFVIEPAAVDELPKPVQGVVVNVAEVSGTVLVGLQAEATGARGSAHASQKGIKFVPLSEAKQIPVGSFLDTRKGTVDLQSAANRSGKRQTGRFRSGLFQVRQSRKRSARGLTDLVLKGGKFGRCRAGPRQGRERRAEPGSDQAPAVERQGALPHQRA